GVVTRQHAKGTREAHKSHRHLGWCAVLLGWSHLMNGTGRKTQRRPGAEAHHLLGRAGVAANWLTVRIEALEHPYGLKEVERISCFEEAVLYRRICSPALGGHRFKGSSRCWVVAMS